MVPPPHLAPPDYEEATKSYAPPSYETATNTKLDEFKFTPNTPESPPQSQPQQQQSQAVISPKAESSDSYNII